MPDALAVKPIGWVESVFKEKFGAPRQSGVVPAACGVLHFYPPYNQADAFEGIAEFSHLWLLSQFHLLPEKEGFRPKVRPPKLGGVERRGVFATRSPFRPNPLGLSVVSLERVVRVGATVSLEVSGIDMVEGTPILDVKPYVPYADAHPEAAGGFSMPPSTALTVKATVPEVWHGVDEKQILLITQTLQAQPQPAYTPEGRTYGLQLGQLNIKWRYEGDEIRVDEVTPL